MTREEIEGQYRVESGIIRSPGKFEGTPVWAPFYWDLSLEGCADDEECDEHDTLVEVFDVDSSDVEMFPELSGVKQVRLWSDDQGFVHTKSE